GGRGPRPVGLPVFGIACFGYAALHCPDPSSVATVGGATDRTRWPGSRQSRKDWTGPWVGVTGLLWLPVRWAVGWVGLARPVALRLWRVTGLLQLPVRWVVGLGGLAPSRCDCGRGGRSGSASWPLGVGTVALCRR